MKKSIFFLLVVAPLISSAQAGGIHPLMTPQELEIQDVARKRLYPGGNDEENLKVIPQLVNPVRKKGPVTEALQEEEPVDRD